MTAKYGEAPVTQEALKTSEATRGSSCFAHKRQGLALAGNEEIHARTSTREDGGDMYFFSCNGAQGTMRAGSLPASA